MVDSGIQKGCDIGILAHASANPPTTQVNFITSADISLDGKLVDISAFGAGGAAGCGGYIKQKQAIKDCKVTLKGNLDKADAGQLVFWTEYGSGAGCRVKITFGTAGTYYLNAFLTVDNIAVSLGPEKFNEVTYSLSNAGATYLDAEA